MLNRKEYESKRCHEFTYFVSESLVYYIPGVQCDLKIEHAVMIVSGSVAILINNEPYRSMF
jgi:hypothetical protein